MSQQQEDRIGQDETFVMRPKLEIRDVGKSPRLLTVLALENAYVDGKRNRTIIFTEFPEKALWLNNTMLATCVAHLGDKPSEWVGKTVPVGIVPVEYQGSLFHKLYITETDGWPADLAAQAWK